MNQLAASEAIFSRWITLWPGLSSGVPYSFDNIAVPEDETHAHVGIVSLPSEQWTLSREHRKWHRPGLIEVRLTGPLNEGRKNLDILAGVVRAIYQGKRFGDVLGVDEGVITHATSVNELKRDRDATQLWILSCVTPCEWWEIA